MKEKREAEDGLERAKREKVQPSIRYYTDLLAFLNSDAERDLTLMEQYVNEAEECTNKLPPAPNLRSKGKVSRVEAMARLLGKNSAKKIR